MPRQETLALFPLGIVPFPGGLVPLHIVEPRYRQLVADRLADDRPFGVVYGTDQQHADVGCALDIQGIIQKLPDGRLNIIARGYRRFRIVRPAESPAPYAVVRAEWIDDEREDVPPALVERTRESFRHVAQVRGWGLNLPIDVEQDAAMLSWLIGDSMELAPEARQELLEMTSPTGRLETEARWLDALMGG